MLMSKNGRRKREKNSRFPFIFLRPSSLVFAKAGKGKYGLIFPVSWMQLAFPRVFRNGFLRVFLLLPPPWGQIFLIAPLAVSSPFFFFLLQILISPMCSPLRRNTTAAKKEHLPWWMGAILVRSSSFRLKKFQRKKGATRKRPSTTRFFHKCKFQRS